MRVKLSRRFFLGAATVVSANAFVSSCISNIDEQAIPTAVSEAVTPSVAVVQPTESLTQAEIPSVVVPSPTAVAQIDTTEYFKGVKAFNPTRITVGSDRIAVINEFGNVLRLSTYLPYQDGTESLIEFYSQEEERNGLEYRFFSLESRLSVDMGGVIRPLYQNFFIDEALRNLSNTGYVHEIYTANGANFAKDQYGTVVTTSNEVGLPNNILDNVQQVASSGNHILFLTIDAQSGNSNVISWGSNTNGETLVPVGLTGVQSIVAGNGFSAALLNDGTVTCWGLVKPVAGKFRKIVAGSDCIAGITDQGNLVVWGVDTVDRITDTFVPSDIGEIKDFSVGGNKLGILTSDNNVLVYEIFSRSEVSNYASTGKRSLPAQICDKRVVFDSREFEKFTSVHAYANAFAVMKENNDFILFGRDEGLNYGEFAGLYFSFEALNELRGKTLKFSTISTSIVVTTDKKIAFAMSSIEEGTSALLQYLELKKLDDVSEVCTGDLLATYSVPLPLFGYALIGGKVVWFTRDASEFPDPYPEVTKNLTDIITLDQGYGYHIALRSDGLVFAWGRNDICTQVPLGLKSVKKIVAGSHHVIALKDDGTVVTWGYEQRYYENTMTPALTNVVDVGASKDSYEKPSFSPSLYEMFPEEPFYPGHFIAVDNSGSVHVWGDNNHGQSSIPAKLPKVVAVAAGDGYSSVLTAEGHVVCWGRFNLII